MRKVPRRPFNGIIKLVLIPQLQQAGEQGILLRQLTLAEHNKEKSLDSIPR
jgi:hypothetical protein